MQIWFSSDFHLGHDRIRDYCNRPFKNLQEMDSTIIKNFNDRVISDDLVFFLGDFCFKASSEAKNSLKDAYQYYRNQLNCKNIVFIEGNHDKNKRNGLRTPIQNLVIKLGGKRIFLTHNPEFCNINYDLNIVGHVHDKWKVKRFKKGEQFTDCINVSIEQWNYKPITINEIFQAHSIWLKENKNG